MELGPQRFPVGKLPMKIFSIAGRQAGNVGRGFMTGGVLKLSKNDSFL